MSTTRGGSLSGTGRSVLSIRVWDIFKGIGFWLDARSLRSYPQDTHSWSAKTETLRALGTAASRPALARGGRVPALQPAAGCKRAPGRLGPHHRVVFGAVASHSC